MVTVHRGGVWAVLVVVGVGAVACDAAHGGASGRTTLTAAGATAPETRDAVAASAAGPDIAGLVSKVSPSVVNITATQELRRPTSSDADDPLAFFFGRRSEAGQGHRDERDDIVRRRGLGSGFLLDAAGHVVTNAHVVENATRVRVTLSDERELDATVKGRDERLDLAVLELRGAKDLPHVSLGRSEALRVGEYVLAIGNPFGLGHTVTMGIVSAKGRELGAGPYDDFIQTDASINPGNSGGPLFNLRGEVVGISTAVVSGGQGIGFAIPSDALEDVLPQLLHTGAVARGRLGLSVQVVDASLAKALGLDKPKGALVDEVERSSAAERAGLRSGDVVVAVDDAPVVHAHDLARLVARHPPGARVRLLVVARGKPPRTIDATLDRLRDDDAEEGTGIGGAEQRGGALLPPPPPAAHDLGLEVADAHGNVVVKSVDPGSPAAEHLDPGDIILEVNGARASNAIEATARVRSTPTGRTVLLKVTREDHVFFVALERR